MTRIFSLVEDNTTKYRHPSIDSDANLKTSQKVRADDGLSHQVRLDRQATLAGALSNIFALPRAL